jgi:hypothetical protein
MLAAPEVSFLGGRQSAQGRYITVSFSGIDEQPARRLAADLEGILAATCSRLAGINCPDAFHVIMTLVTEPGSIADIGSLEGGLVATNELLLPTPTLVGLPNDETGYRALLRAYGQRVVAATVATLVEYECCDNALFFRALLDLQMGQLGIRAWPVTQNQYRSALQGGFLQGQDSWGSDLTLDEWMDRPDWWQSYVLVEFLASISEESTVAAMQRRLSQELDFNTWLAHAISNDSFEDGVLRDAWTRFLLSKTAIG